MGKNVTYKIDSKYFRLKEPGLTYKLKEGVSTLIVTPVKIERISGKVKTPGGAGIDSVKILVGVSGELITYTNSNGDFELTLPEGIQHEQITVGASKQGFEYSAGQPTFSSTYDVVSSKNITIIFARKSDPTLSTHTDSTTYSSFILKYENEKITFNFPINPSMKIQHLRDFIYDELASAYSSTKAQCHISYYGNKLNLADPLRQVNLPNNAEISLVCNGDVIYLNRFVKFRVTGKEFKDPIVLINDKIVVAKNQNGELNGASGMNLFGSLNRIVIYDMNSRREFVYPAVSIPENHNFMYSVLVLNITQNGNMRVQIP